MDREDVEAHIRRAISARVAEFKSGPAGNHLVARTRRYASTYAMTIIVAAVAARYVHSDEPLHRWMNFADDAIVLAVCVLVLEASMYVKLLAVEAQYRLGDLSNVMTWLAVILGACGFVARLIQRGAEGVPLTVMLFRAVGLELVLGVMMGSIALIVLGDKLRNRA